MIFKICPVHHELNHEGGDERLDTYHNTHSIQNSHLYRRVRHDENDDKIPQKRGDTVSRSTVAALAIP